MKSKPYVAPAVEEIVTATGRLLSESLHVSDTVVTDDGQVFSPELVFYDDIDEDDLSADGVDWGEW